MYPRNPNIVFFTFSFTCNCGFKYSYASTGTATKSKSNIYIYTIQCTNGWNMGLKQLAKLPNFCPY